LSGKSKKPSEFEIIDFIRRQHRYTARVVLGIGDDCAVTDVSLERYCLITTDMLIEGVHFRLTDATPFDIGWKSVACGISDIAAMGCEATTAVVSAGFRKDVTAEFVGEFHAGLKTICERYGIELVGGDITSTDGAMVVCATVLGRDAGLTPVTRSGAQPGDIIMVTGELGGSILGKHLRFYPRMNEAVYLNRVVELHAMIDISDGLSADLNHILEESGVGAVLNADKIPISEDCRKLARQTRKPALRHALTDGEDYELLFTLPKEDARRLLERQPLAVRLSAIGRITKRKGLFIRHRGKTKKLKPGGWEHLKQ